MAGVFMRDKSSLITSLIFRIGSPRITFSTSSVSSVSCSMSARASCERVLQLVNRRQIKYRGIVHGVVLAASIGEEQKPLLDPLGAVCTGHTIINGTTGNNVLPHLRTSFSISSRLLAEMLSSRSLRYTGPIFSEYPQFCEQDKASCLPLI